jgi:hypothetical protein
MTKLTLSPMKPRNPLVCACRFRRAGAHGPLAGARRQRAAQALRREIERLRPTSP